MSRGLYGILISNNERNLHFATWGLSVLVLVFGRICIPYARWFMAQGLYTTSGWLEHCSCRRSVVQQCVILALHCYKSRIGTQRCTQIFMSKSLSLYCMINNFSSIWIMGARCVVDPEKQGSSCRFYCNGEKIGRKEKAELLSLILTRGGFVHLLWSAHAAILPI